MECLIQNFLIIHEAKLKTHRPEVILRYVRIKFKIQISSVALHKRIKALKYKSALDPAG